MGYSSGPRGLLRVSADDCAGYCAWRRWRDRVSATITAAQLTMTITFGAIVVHAFDRGAGIGNTTYLAMIGAVNKHTGKGSSNSPGVESCGWHGDGCVASAALSSTDRARLSSVVRRNHPTCFVGSDTPQLTRFVLSNRIWPRAVSVFLRVAESTIVMSLFMRRSKVSHDVWPQVYSFDNCSGLSSGRSASNVLLIAICFEHRFEH